jgi:hypothetical protein
MEVEGQRLGFGGVGEEMMQGEGEGAAATERREGRR